MKEVHDAENLRASKFPTFFFLISSPRGCTSPQYCTKRPEMRATGECMGDRDYAVTRIGGYPFQVLIVSRVHAALRGSLKSPECATVR